MCKIGAAAARRRFGELLVIVENGEAVTITRHGRPVAKLVPADRRDPAKIAEAIAELKRLRSQVRLGEGETVRGLIDAGRRL